MDGLSPISLSVCDSNCWEWNQVQKPPRPNHWAHLRALHCTHFQIFIFERPYRSRGLLCLSNLAGIKNDVIYVLPNTQKKRGTQISVSQIGVNVVTFIELKNKVIYLPTFTFLIWLWAGDKKGHEVSFSVKGADRHSADRVKWKPGRPTLPGTAQRKKKGFEQQSECISSQPIPLIDLMWPIYNERVERGTEFIVKGELKKSNTWGFSVCAVSPVCSLFLSLTSRKSDWLIIWNFCVEFPVVTSAIWLQLSAQFLVQPSSTSSLHS